MMLWGLIIVRSVLILMRESKQNKTDRSVKIFEILSDHYPPVTTFLTHKNNFELLIAVILSAQCTDERVNLVTPKLFKVLPTPQKMADAEPEVVRDLIKSINFFNNKSKNIQKTAHILHTKYNGDVPARLDELITLPGVGRKTANVILGQSFNIPGITVDTHVNRLTNRLGFTKNNDAVKIEYDLIKIWPEVIWIDFSTLLILHGREVCNARKPKCAECIISDYCPSDSR